jgi:hypothetical protein
MKSIGILVIVCANGKYIIHTIISRTKMNQIFTFELEINQYIFGYMCVQRDTTRIQSYHMSCFNIVFENFHVFPKPHLHLKCPIFHVMWQNILPHWRVTLKIGIFYHMSWNIPKIFLSMWKEYLKIFSHAHMLVLMFNHSPNHVSRIKWGLSKQPIDLMNNLNVTTRKASGDLIIMVLLKWFSKSQGNFKFNYDTTNINWMDINLIISIITMN